MKQATQFRIMKRGYSAISKSYFEKYYEPSDGYKFGTDGIYQKKPQTVLVLELQQTRRLDFRDGRGVLFGEKGDWMVDYGNGELSIVRKDHFNDLYELEESVKVLNEVMQKN
jgi:PGDYG protein